MEEYREDLERAEAVDIDCAEDHDGHIGNIHVLLYLFEEQDDVLQIDPHLALLMLFNYHQAPHLTL